MAIRTLTFTTLYPSETIPHHGIFVEQRLRHLLQSGEVETRVVAPVPWFPFKHRSMGQYGQFASIPRIESRHGIDIAHPRFPLIPKIGMSISPLLMAMALRSSLKAGDEEAGGFDLIDAHYFYPDGVAATLLGRWLNKPVVITARGTDINLIPEYTMPRKWILWAARHCAAMITVSDALRDRLIELGADAGKVRTLRNGVDLDLFCPSDDKKTLRRKLGVNGWTLLSVGNLIESKGHHLAIEALQHLRDVHLIIIGEGKLREGLEKLAERLGVANRVRFVGALPHNDLPQYYNAADALILASSREGMANVILESIACGTPVAATSVGGNPEVLSDRRAGVLIEGFTVSAVSDAIRSLMNNRRSRKDTRIYASQFSWDRTTKGQIELFQEVLSAF